MDINEAIQGAQHYLRGVYIPQETLEAYADLLYNERKFSYARRIYARLHSEGKMRESILRRWAVCTYKDDDQPGSTRFDEAAGILFQQYGRNAKQIKSSRAAGNLGSIFKQKWQFDSQEMWLKKSLSYYNRGHQLWWAAWEKEAPALRTNQDVTIDPDSNFFDQGYCAINAAYVCDTLATLQKRIADQDPTLLKIVESLQQEARSTRRQIVEYCTGAEAYYQQKKLVGTGRKGGYWFYATWAEALMGLGKEQCTTAIEKMKTALDYAQDPAKTSVTPSWHRESSAQQIANWIEEDHFGGDETYRSLATQLLEIVIGAPTYGSRSQRIGLGLSGGGFRASIFHIGVLARLAEEDLLHNIEVISCVSGGSIVGAYYYLKVRNLLQSKPDSQITKADYIQIVREIEHDFVSDISYNMRSHIFGNLGNNVKMGCNPNFSRTSRLADLYEKHLYAKLLDKKAEAKAAAERAKKQTAAAAPGTPADKKEGEEKEQDIDPAIYMHDLLIAPLGEDGTPRKVSPKRVNWLRKNKIPILVLNATTLNTGHCWQFTATWMGEPPGYINSETDALPTLRRTYYEDAPAPHNKIRLATAVGASSCVPGLFRPVELRDLYEQHSGKLIDVQLVDGGVYDNQGINTLVEQECNVLIISDASGQLASVDAPGAGALQVGGRTNEILQGRIRACELGELSARFNAQLVRGYLLMHLTKGLPSEVVNWRQCDDPYEPNVYDDSRHGDDVLTNYEVRKNIQTALARIRTDLDSFHEQEAAMLMYSGYLMTDFEIKAGKGWGLPRKYSTSFAAALPPVQFKKEEWEFERIKPLHDHPDTSEHLLKTLNTSAGMVKILSASALIRNICLLLLACLLGWLGWRYWPGLVPFLAGIGVLVLVYAAYRQIVVKHRFNPVLILLAIVLGPLVFLLGLLFTKWFNRLYLKSGTLPARQLPDMKEKN